MINKKYCSLCLILLFLGGWGLSVEATSKETERPKIMRIVTASPSDQSIAKALNYFAEKVNNQTDNSVQVEVYSNGQFGGERENFESVQLGILQGTVLSTAVLSSFYPQISVFDLPYLFPDRYVAYRVLDGPIGAKLLANLLWQDVIGLNYWEIGFRHLTNNVREVRTPEDVKGLKIRTMESEAHLDIWNALGGRATPMAFPELFSGLQQKVVDGQETPYSIIAINKLYSVQDYLTATKHVYSASPFVVSKAFWMTLTADEKKVIRQAAEDAQTFQRKLEYKLEKKYRQILKENGIKETVLTEKEKEVFERALKTVYKKRARKIGEGLVEKVVKETRGTKG